MVPEYNDLSKSSTQYLSNYVLLQTKVICLVCFYWDLFVKTRVTQSNDAVNINNNVTLSHTIF